MTISISERIIVIPDEYLPIEISMLLERYYETIEQYTPYSMIFVCSFDSVPDSLDSLLFNSELRRNIFVFNLFIRNDVNHIQYELDNIMFSFYK